MFRLRAIRFTRMPIFEKIEAYSQPITPAPIMVTFLGRCFISSMVSESKTHSLSKGAHFGLRGEEPVAMIVYSVVISYFSVSSTGCISRLVGDRNRGDPSITVIWFFSKLRRNELSWSCITISFRYINSLVVRFSLKLISIP